MYENGTNIGNTDDCYECRQLEKENNRLQKKLLAQKEVIREVFNMFVNLGATRSNNIVLQFSDDIDAELVYDDITKRMGDCLPNSGTCGKTEAYQQKVTPHAQGETK